MNNQINIPNHICKYSGCHYGSDGGRKHYYACPDCDAMSSWRSMGCCFEHYLCYQNEVARSRGVEMPWTEVLDMMVIDGVINDSYTKSEGIKNLEVVEDICDDESVKSDFSRDALTPRKRKR